MADWSSLEPLKKHSRIMTFVAIILGAILVFTPKHAFRTQAETSNVDNSITFSTVKAVSGLSIRNAPNVNSTILTTAPNHATLAIIDDNVSSDSIGGRSGNWFKVEYRGIKGYAWGNYIEK